MVQPRSDMNSLFETSSLSFSSSGSLFTTDTDTTASTEWGPGTLMGRGLMAFGEAAKDALDNLIIQRRLATFKSIFPYIDTGMGFNKALDRTYQDLFELCR